MSLTLATNTLAGSSTAPFRFLDLPGEIRSKIYVFLTLSPTQYISLNLPSSPSSKWPDTPSIPTFPSALLLTNHQLYHESLSAYFSVNTFTLTIRRHNLPWAFFLLPPFTPHRRQMRALRLVIQRWGTKDFFARELVPVVEDAILSGKLRVLEVLVKDSYVSRLEEGKWESWGEENGNWTALRRLCRDPDLERVSVKAGPLEIFGDDVEGDEARDFLNVTDWVRG